MQTSGESEDKIKEIHLMKSLELKGLSEDERYKKPESEVLNLTRNSLRNYFYFGYKTFDLPLDFSQGTDFQKRVWKVLQQIPFGETKSYREVAILAGSPKAQRAVGQAVNKNPFLIVVPCHRVIKSDGGTGGFGAGLDKKRALMKHEGIETK